MEKVAWSRTTWSTHSIGDLFSSDDLRVWIDLEKGLADAPIEVRAGTAASLGADSFPPWFWDDHRLVDFHDPAARPRTFAELVADPDFDLPDTRPFSLALLLPCYLLQDGQALVLDGNHRFLSLLINSPTTTVVQVGLKGPIDPEILPDLRHWSPE